MLAFLGALSMFLSTLEYLLPKPFPFFRFGLANIPLLVALELLPLRSYLVLVALKTLGQALVNGTLASYVFLFSVSGTAASALLMFAARRAFGRSLSLIGVSILGALSSSAVQIALSITVVFGPEAARIAPLFLSFSIPSGALVGWMAQRLWERSEWVRRLRAVFPRRCRGP